MPDTFDVSAFRTENRALAEHVMVDELSRGKTLQYEAKLAQRVLVELLTEKLSMPFAPGRGTSFVTRLRSGQVRTEHDLFVAFSLARIDLDRNLRAEERSSDEPRSRYRGARLLGLRLAPLSGMAELTIEITTRAGTQANLVLPVNVKL